MTRSGRPATCAVASSSSFSVGRSSGGHSPMAAAARTSTQVCLLRSSASSTSRASGSTPPAIPSALRTCAAKPWMVVMVAASKSAIAPLRRERWRATSPDARWRATLSSPTSGCPGSSRSATSISRSWTRPRSSLVAARVKVTIRSSDGEMSDSARYRVAKSASVYVLPVPALASMARHRSAARRRRRTGCRACRSLRPAAVPADSAAVHPVVDSSMAPKK